MAGSTAYRSNLRCYGQTRSHPTLPLPHPSIQHMQVLFALAKLGYTDPLLDGLVEAAAGARAGSAPLLSLLGRSGAKRLLQLVEAAMEEAPDASLLDA